LFYDDIVGLHEFGEITQNKGHYAVQGHSRQGHQFWYQSKAHMRLPISDWLILTYRS